MYIEHERGMYILTLVFLIVNLEILLTFLSFCRASGSLKAAFSLSLSLCLSRGDSYVACSPVYSDRLFHGLNNCSIFLIKCPGSDVHSRQEV